MSLLKVDEVLTLSPAGGRGSWFGQVPVDRGARDFELLGEVLDGVGPLNSAIEPRIWKNIRPVMMDVSMP